MRLIVLIFSFLFVYSCGKKNKDNLSYYNAIHGNYNNCGPQAMGAYGNYNNFYNNYQYGYANAYQLEMARRCGYAIANMNCYMPSNQVGVQAQRVDVEGVRDFITDIEAELRDVHGWVEPLESQSHNHYTQSGFNFNFSYRYGYNYGYNYGNPYYGHGHYGYNYCNQIQL